MQHFTMRHDFKTDSFERACEEHAASTKLKKDDLSRYHPVEFQASWLDADGLPSKLGEWIGANLKSGERYRGSRWGKRKSLDFQIHAKQSIIPEGGPTNFRAVFELENDRRMVVTPGQIEVFDQNDDELLARYIECNIEGGSTWKMDLEVRRTYLRNYHDCPTILARAYQFIDTMVFEMTKVADRRPSVLLSMLGPARHYSDPWGCKLTPYVIENVFHYVANLYHSELKPSAADFNTYNAMLETLRCIALGELDREGKPVKKKYSINQVLHEGEGLPCKVQMAITVKDPKEMVRVAEWPTETAYTPDKLTLTKIVFKRDNGEVGTITNFTHMQYSQESEQNMPPPHRLSPPGRGPIPWLYRTTFMQTIPGHEQYGQVAVFHEIDAKTGKFGVISMRLYLRENDSVPVEPEKVEVLEYTVLLDDPVLSQELPAWAGPLTTQGTGPRRPIARPVWK